MVIQCHRFRYLLKAYAKTYISYRFVSYRSYCSKNYYLPFSGNVVNFERNGPTHKSYRNKFKHLCALTYLVNTAKL